MTEGLQSGDFEKKYLAVLCGTPEEERATLCNYLRKNTVNNMVYICTPSEEGAKYAELDYKVVESKGKYAVKCDATNVSTKRLLLQKLTAMTEEKRARAEAKGLNRTFRFMVAGIPNTGKSTVVNLMSGQKRAKTGDKAGVTRDVRWLKCGAFDLLDTPGTMPPSFLVPM